MLIPVSNDNRTHTWCQSKILRSNNTRRGTKHQLSKPTTLDWSQGKYFCDAIVAYLGYSIYFSFVNFFLLLHDNIFCYSDVSPTYISTYIHTLNSSMFLSLCGRLLWATHSTVNRQNYLWSAMYIYNPIFTGCFSKPFNIFITLLWNQLDLYLISLLNLILCPSLLSGYENKKVSEHTLLHFLYKISANG